MPRRRADPERPSVAEPLLAPAGAGDPSGDMEPSDAAAHAAGATFEVAENENAAARRESVGSATPSGSEHSHCGGEGVVSVRARGKGGGGARGEALLGLDSPYVSTRAMCVMCAGHHSRLKYYRTLCDSNLLDTRIVVPPPHIIPPQHYLATTPLPLALNHGEQLVWGGEDGQGKQSVCAHAVCASVCPSGYIYTPWRVCL